MLNRKLIVILFTFLVFTTLFITVRRDRAYAAAPPAEAVSVTAAPSPVSAPSPRPSELPEVDIHGWELEIFSVSHPVDYTPELTRVEGAPVDVRIADSLSAMVNAARGAGLRVYISSAYRDEATQEYLCRRYEEKYGVDKARCRIALPGASEHQAGLACDITDKYYPDKTEELKNTELFEWLSEHCCEYGFVVRYPEGRKFTCGFEYMPWHFRYVGVEAAVYMTENDLCLEEFTALYGQSGEQREER